MSFTGNADKHARADKKKTPYDEIKEPGPVRGQPDSEVHERLLRNSFDMGFYSGVAFGASVKSNHAVGFMEPGNKYDTWQLEKLIREKCDLFWNSLRRREEDEAEGKPPSEGAQDQPKNNPPPGLPPLWDAAATKEKT